MKDKEWLKEEVYKLIEGYTSFGGYEHTFIAGANVNKLGVLIDQLDEPKKPIIPQFVANYIEKWKYEGITMQEWFTLDCDNVNDEDYLVFKWLQDKNSEENNKGDYLLINSIRYGYEVEVTQ